MVEAAPSCALLGGFAIGARVALLWQHNANPSYTLVSIPRYDDIVRTAGWAGSARVTGRRPAGNGGRPQNRAPHTGSGRGRPVGDRPLTGGVLNITAAVWTAGFRWWRSGNKKRTQNICLVDVVAARTAGVAMPVNHCRGANTEDDMAWSAALRPALPHRNEGRNSLLIVMVGQTIVFSCCFFLLSFFSLA